MAPGRSRKPDRPGPLPVQQQVGQLRGRAGEDGRVAGVLVPGQLVQPGLAAAAAAARAGRGTPPGRRRRASLVARPGLAARISATIAAACAGVAWRHEADVGRPGDQPVRPRSRAPARDTTGWPCGGRGVIDGPLTLNQLAGEVDVVQLVAVDEPPGRDVADLGVVLPAVPQPPDHLDVVGRLVEQLGSSSAGRAAGPQVEPREARRPKCAASSGLRRDPDPDARPGPC